MARVEQKNIDGVEIKVINTSNAKVEVEKLDNGIVNISVLEPDKEDSEND